MAPALLRICSVQALQSSRCKLRSLPADHQLYIPGKDIRITVGDQSFRKISIGIQPYSKNTGIAFHQHAFCDGILMPSLISFHPYPAPDISIYCTPDAEDIALLHNASPLSQKPLHIAGLLQIVYTKRGYLSICTVLQSNFLCIYYLDFAA